MEIERIVNDLYRESYWRTGPVLMSAISAIEMALWDIKGKFYKASIYDLIGGKVRSTIRMYANGWFSGAKEPEQFATAAKKAVSLGISALKWDPFGSAYMSMTRKEFFHAIAIVEAVRAAVGNDVDLLIEGHDFHSHIGIFLHLFDCVLGMDVRRMDQFTMLDTEFPGFFHYRERIFISVMPGSEHKIMIGTNPHNVFQLTFHLAVFVKQPDSRIRSIVVVDDLLMMIGIDHRQPDILESRESKAFLHGNRIETSDSFV